MVYPQNNATGVPDSFTLILTKPVSPVQLQSSGSAPFTIQPTAPNSDSFVTGTLRAHTTYSVIAPVSYCMSLTGRGVIGSFTTN